jgi:chromosome segregation ATPase
MKRATEKALKKMAGNGFPAVREALDEIEQLRTEVKQLQDAIVKQAYRRDKEYAKRDAEIARLHQQAAEDDAALAQAGHMYDAQNAEIERLRAEAADKDLYIIKESENVAELSAEIERLRGLLREWAKEFDDADWAETFVDMVRATNLDRRTKEALGDVPKPD